MVAPANTERGQPKEESEELKKRIGFSILPSLHEDIQKVAQMQSVFVKAPVGCKHIIENKTSCLILIYPLYWTTRREGVFMRYSYEFKQKCVRCINSENGCHALHKTPHYSNPGPNKSSNPITTTTALTAFQFCCSLISVVSN